MIDRPKIWSAGLWTLGITATLIGGYYAEALDVTPATASFHPGRRSSSTDALNEKVNGPEPVILTTATAVDLVASDPPQVTQANFSSGKRTAFAEAEVPKVY
ncbi:hypothetical protein [Sphingomonas crocodyli]|uniref:Uncharacterized protein n=1 Tax=Sphingomonas crocodyli TaxID=1979270 RepID=A0A437LXV8_9SPHN|nr:hypothetical protein [Sphingomonas crocodyli]RVT90212.1 hypothetical protein EOD43_18110 [Sphingomonas crocodyli]